MDFVMTQYNLSEFPTGSCEHTLNVYEERYREG
jgi:hypothetical protein